MKRAQIITIGVALAAGAGVLYMMSNQKPPPAPVIASMPAAPPPIPTDDVLVAARELPMGTLIAEPDLQWVGWPRTAAGPGMIKKSELPNAVEDIKGSVARGSFFQGEPIRREKVVKGPNSGFLSAILPSGKRAVAINIDALAVSGRGFERDARGRSARGGNTHHGAAHGPALDDPAQHARREEVRCARR